jgi:osmoprotectant transport system substrate-binding protein
MTRKLRGASLALVALLAVSACGEDKESANPLATTAPTSGAAAGAVTVGSANFPESVLLGEIYAQALEAKGVKVTKKLNIGSREVLYKQIETGGLSVLPEYNGALLAYLDKSSKASTTDEVNTELKAKLPASLKLLDSAKAEDKDSVAVTQETATKHSLKALPDLKAVAGQLVLGGPPEFKTRQQGVLGLESVYGVKFKSFKSLDTAGPLTVSALKKGDVDAANLFSTDPAIVANEFVVLEDPENLFGSQNVTPLIHSSADNETVRSTLNALSAKLDTPTLADLVKQVVADKEDADSVAGDWLKSVGLI